MGTEHTAPATRDAERVAAETARNLGRLLSCAAMYPAGHPLLAEAAERAMQHVSGGPLVVSVLPDELVVRSQRIGLHDRETGRLHEDLCAVGISDIRFADTATNEDLYSFADGLLRAKAEAAKSAGFVEVDVSNHLPESVQVKLRGFGARIADADAATARVLGVLEDLLAADDSDVVADAVDLIVPDVVARFEDGDLAAAGAIPLGRGLDEVLDLCATALRAGVEDLLSSGGQLGDLPALIEATENAMPVADDPEAMEFMIEVLRQAADDAANNGAIEAAFDAVMDVGYDLTMEELRESVAALRRSAKPIDASVRSVELAETLSIVMQLCQTKPSREALDGISAKLDRVHGAKWSEREADILERGVARLAEINDTVLMDGVMPALLKSLRSDGADLLPEVVVNLARTAMHTRTEELLWPHIVNQLLLGLFCGDQTPSSGQDDSEVSRFVRACDPSNDGELWQRLAKLEAIEENRVADEVLGLEERDLYPVVAALLTKDSRRFGDRVFCAMRDRPMAWLGANAIKSATAWSPNVRDLVLEMLATDGRFETSARAAGLAATIIVESIRALPPERRDEPWVAQTLHALGRLDPIDEEGLLRQVMKERKHFRSVWPKACRLAAQEGLRPAGGRL